MKRAVTAAQERARRGEIAPDRVADIAVAMLPSTITTLQPVLNATGVVLHTNLGRAALGPSVRKALDVAAGYVDLEFDLATGRRATRGRGALAALRDAVPGAEDVLVVNNGAAALVLAATVLGAGRELVVSRGELVEIGDGFRLPDLLTSTGARLREVGTTNRTVLARLHLRRRGRHRGDRQGASVELPPGRVHRHRARARTGRPRAAGRRRRRLRPAPGLASAAAGTGRRRRPAGRGRPRYGKRRQAARRSAGRPGSGSTGFGGAVAPPSACPGAAAGQAPPRRVWRRPCAGRGRPPRPPCTPRAPSCGSGRKRWPGGCTPRAST